jgi:DNA invertase Pin-like site-specific DNA recombinase
VNNNGVGQQKQYTAALYMRLSRDDGIGESASIGTQREMLRSYAQKHGFIIFDEYVDDGCSGTNFDRPAWKRMIADIEQHKINLVLTKDLSRLGRDYITAGQYTELYFPAHGVRCIAVNDGYDSAGPYTDLVPFKNVMNEWYARDISQKIRGALHTKMEAGAFIGNYAPYGYRKDPQDHNRLLPDSVSAPVVKRIFRMAADGRRPSEIAEALNQQGIPPPSVYRALRLSQQMPPDFSKRGWSPSTICKMLHNVVYLGHMVQGKTTKLSFKSTVVLQNAPENRVLVRSTHEPLVPQRVFDLVQKHTVSRRPAAQGTFVNLFSGLAKCADCGRNLSSSGTGQKGKKGLVCSGYKLYGRKTCSSHFIRYTVLCQAVLRDLRVQLNLSSTQRQQVLHDMQQNIPKAISDSEQQEIADLQTRQRKLKQILRQLYEDHVSGLLSDSRFQDLLASFGKEQRALTAQLSVLRPRTAASKSQIADIHWLETFCRVPELTQDLLFAFIKRIDVGQAVCIQGGRAYRRQHITIVYAFSKPEK